MGCKATTTIPILMLTGYWWENFRLSMSFLKRYRTKNEKSDEASKFDSEYAIVLINGVNFSYFEQLVVFFDALSARRGCSRARAATSNSPRCMQDAHVLSSSSFSPPLPSSHSFPSTKVLVLCPSQKHSSLLLWFIPVLGTEVEV